MASSHRGKNLGPLERAISLSLGAVAAAMALRRRGAVPTTLLSVAGGLLLYRGVTGRSALYHRLGITGSEVGRTISACSQVTVQLPAAQVHALLRDLGGLPQFSEYLESTQQLDDDRWMVRLRTPFDGEHEIEVRRTADEEGRRLAWATLGEGSFPAALELRFIEGRMGTEIHADAWIVPPVAAVVAAALARAERSRPLRRAGLGPSQLLEQELRRLRQLLEAGETATVKGQSAGGRRARRVPQQRLEHPEEVLP